MSQLGATCANVKSPCALQFTSLSHFLASSNILWTLSTVNVKSLIQQQTGIIRESMYVTTLLTCLSSEQPGLQ